VLTGQNSVIKAKKGHEARFLRIVVGETAACKGDRM
jgi:hypothetical protein